jgi:hypothetical protein
MTKYLKKRTKNNQTKKKKIRRNKRRKNKIKVMNGGWILGPGECPGEEVLSVSQKTIGTPKRRRLTPNNIYYMRSHGCDSSDLEDVPPNCVYVTLAQCGEKIDSNNAYRSVFEKLFRENDDLLKDPVKNKAVLTHLFGVTLHIKYPNAKDPEMRKYVNSAYTCFLGFNDDGKTFAKKSGLYSIGSNPSILFDESTQVNPGDIYYVLNNGEVTMKNVRFLYEDSLYPTPNDFISQEKRVQYESVPFSEFHKDVTNTFSIDQKTLFKYFPGVHYNFSCRSDCRDAKNPSEAHILRRENSKVGSEQELQDTLIGLLTIGETDKARELIESDTNSYEIHQIGNGLLKICCEKGYLDIGKLLLEKGGVQMDTVDETLFGCVDDIIMRWDDL